MYKQISISTYVREDWSRYAESYHRTVDKAGTKLALNALVAETVFSQITSMFFDVPKVHLLELGCGPGSVLQSLRDYGASHLQCGAPQLTLTGVDNLEEFIAIAQDRFADDPHFSAHAGDITENYLGLPKEIYKQKQKDPFHVVLFVNSFYCLTTPQQEAVLKNIASVLDPKGLIIINDPSRSMNEKDRYINFPKGMVETMGLEAAKSFYRDHAADIQVINEINLTNLKKYNYRDLPTQKEFLEKNGFRIVSEIEKTFCTLSYLVCLQKQ